jgi:hypothetical protein
VDDYDYVRGRRMDVDDEVSFRLPLATASGYNLRRRRLGSSTIPEVGLSVERTPDNVSTAGRGRRMSNIVDKTASISRDGESSELLKQEIRRLNVHTEGLKEKLSHLRTYPESAEQRCTVAQTATVGGPSLSSQRWVRSQAQRDAGVMHEVLASYEQLCSLERTRSREPLARPSGSFEQSRSSEQTRSWEPLAIPSGSFEQS